MTAYPTLNVVHFGKRVWWYPPWRLHRHWFPRAMFASDEYHNDTLFVVVPLFGGFVFAYRSGSLSTVECVGNCPICFTEEDYGR